MPFPVLLPLIGGVIGRSVATRAGASILGRTGAQFGGSALGASMGGGGKAPQQAGQAAPAADPHVAAAAKFTSYLQPHQFGG